jgi:hypothetical protein
VNRAQLEAETSLKTHEREWLAALFRWHRDEMTDRAADEWSDPPEPRSAINYDRLIRALAPTPESVMREALEAIRDAPVDYNTPPRKIAEAALVAVAHIESEA